MNPFEIAMLGLQMGATLWATCHGQWTKALYWFGAFLLTIAVMRGMK